MSGLLLDTHIWLWYAQGNSEKLSSSSIRILEERRHDVGLLVSAISVWEIGILHSRGRVQFSAPLRDWVEEALSPPGISFVPLDEHMAVESTLLPGDPHGDPADRFLLAAARTRTATLATRDEQILAYGRAGHVRVLKL